MPHDLIPAEEMEEMAALQMAFQHLKAADTFEGANKVAGLLLRQRKKTTLTGDRRLLLESVAERSVARAEALRLQQQQMPSVSAATRPSTSASSEGEPNTKLREQLAQADFTVDRGGFRPSAFTTSTLVEPATAPTVGPAGIGVVGSVWNFFGGDRSGAAKTSASLAAEHAQRQAERLRWQQEQTRARLAHSHSVTLRQHAAEKAELGAKLEAAAAELDAYKRREAHLASQSFATERAVKQLLADGSASSQYWAKVALDATNGDVHRAKQWLAKQTIGSLGQVHENEYCGAERTMDIDTIIPSRVNNSESCKKENQVQMWNVGLALEDYSSLQEPPDDYAIDLGPCWLATRELPPEPTLADVASEGAVQVVAARSRRCILKVLRLANGAAVAKLESSLHKLRSVSQAQATEQCRQALFACLSMLPKIWAPVAVFRRYPTEDDTTEALVSSLTGVTASQAVCDAYLELPHVQFGDNVVTLHHMNSQVQNIAGSGEVTSGIAGFRWPIDDCLGFFQTWLHALAVLHSTGIAPAAASCPAGGVLVLRQQCDETLGEYRSRPLVVGAVSSELMTGTQHHSGLLPAAAPEVSSGERPTPAADLYTVGYFMYLALLGREPILLPGRSGPDIPRDLPARLRPVAELLSLLLAADPNERPRALSASSHSCFSTATAVAALANERKVVDLQLKQQVLSDHVKSLKRDHGGRDGMSITVQRQRLCDSVVEQFLRAPGWPRSGHRHLNRRLPGLYGRLRVQFDGEQGVDAGGLTKEMFTLFWDQLFDPHHCTLFESANCAEATAHHGPFIPRPLDPEGLHPDASLAFEGVGRVIAKTFVDDIPVALPLAPSVYRFLSDREDSTKSRTTIHEYAAFDPDSARSCMQILDMDDSSCLFLTFEDVGMPDNETAVTNENRHEYVDRKIWWELEGCRINELRALRRGFTEATADLAAHLALFSPSELASLLRADGLPDLDPQEFLAQIDFTGFPPDSETPQRFNAAVTAFQPKALRRLLRFITAQNALPRAVTVDIPANPALETGDGGRIKISCQRGATDSTLPVAHTCFNRLDFPDYSTYELVKARLQFCIENLDDASFGES